MIILLSLLIPLIMDIIYQGKLIIGNSIKIIINLVHIYLTIKVSAIFKNKLVATDFQRKII